MNQTSFPSGVVIAGNILNDVVKRIDSYPKIGMLSNITSISRAVGGCVPNTGIDLAKIDPSIPIRALGLAGNDEYGDYALAQLAEYGIDVSGVHRTDSHPTGFSDVMQLPTGERTFFHARGANAAFSPSDVDLSSLRGSLLHIGYILLLDTFDREDDEYGTVMARFLCQAQQKGIVTSIDCVSDTCADYQKKILPALRYCNYAIMNEIESCSIWKLEPYHEDGSLHMENIRETMKRMIEAGVKNKVIIHCKKAGFIMDADGNFDSCPSVDVPRSEIKGTVGAGDAFCAGALYAVYHGYDNMETLRFASCAAACNLFSENSVDGMKIDTEVKNMAERYGFSKVPELDNK